MTTKIFGAGDVGAICNNFDDSYSNVDVLISDVYETYLNYTAGGFEPPKNVTSLVNVIRNTADICAFDKFVSPRFATWWICGKQYCPYNIKAINHISMLLGENPQVNSPDYEKKCDFRVLDIEQIGKEKTRELLKKHGYEIPFTFRTSPIIFHNGKFVGGSSELSAKYPIKM